jgi:hypothetical protein
MSQTSLRLGSVLQGCRGSNISAGAGNCPRQCLLFRISETALVNESSATTAFLFDPRIL